MGDVWCRILGTPYNGGGRKRRDLQSINMTLKKYFSELLLEKAFPSTLTAAVSPTTNNLSLYFTPYMEGCPYCHTVYRQDSKMLYKASGNSRRSRGSNSRLVE